MVHKRFISLLSLTTDLVWVSAHINARQASTPSVPAGWISLGCYSDSTSARTLKTAAFTNVTGMTVESCLAFCTPSAYQYAGVEFGRECYCDDLIESTGAPILASGCNMTCTGDSAEICGGPDAINIYSLNTPPPPPAGWASAGCYSDTPDSRTLKVASFTSVNDMTIEACATFCTPAGYEFFGVEFARECYCDNVIEAPAVVETDGGCNMPCTGNAAEVCGGSNRINIYQREGSSSPPSTTTSAATTTTSSASTPTPTIQETAGSFQYKGCFEDAVVTTFRTLGTGVSVSGGVTANGCTAACKAAGFPLAGLEFGQECWCDTFMEIVNNTPDDECNKPCVADPSQLCGAGNRLAVYQDTQATPPSLQTCLSNFQLPLITVNLQAVPNPGGGAAQVLTAVPLGQNTAVPELIILTEFVGISGAEPPATFLLGNTANVSQNDLSIDSSGFGVVSSLQPNVGGAQFFKTVPIGFTDFDGYDQYCATPNPIPLYGPFIGPAVLSINGQNNQWALCANTTAGGRVDVVYSPIGNSPDYTLSQCQSVIIELQT